ncbi:hypothetical protein GT755_12485 [Herbidospora sp. NEAU-GS84]|uniref:Uncharacterized protein n=1 Tax=Herbidospora solisilvae TaxID=2696284 RepID=A0A7C9J349_9ACTN|nr:hypothetical protein [Herbidospora solisilvae]NAS22500.1 hypothetical protein [Herbidospora solisilvae]
MDMERASTGNAVAAGGSLIEDAVKFTVLVVQLAMAGLKLKGLSQQVRATYRYVDGCAASTDRLAEQMAALEVDVDTIGEHRDAAAVMRSVLADADAMAEAAEELAAAFIRTSDAHKADYGTVAEAARTMPVPMADARFYSNR